MEHMQQQGGCTRDAAAARMCSAGPVAGEAQSVYGHSGSMGLSSRPPAVPPAADLEAEQALADAAMAALLEEEET